MKVQNSVYFSPLLGALLTIIVNIDSSHTETVRTESYQVLIIGAGPSGIAAATRLIENGVTNITVLEAENRIGGRIYTIPFDHGMLDMGAQWVHGEKGNVVFEMANEVKLVGKSRFNEESFERCFIMSSGDVLDPELSSTLVNIMHEITNASYSELQEFNGSLGQYFTQRFEEKLSERGINHKASKPFLNWYHGYRNSVDGSDSWFDTSASSVTEFLDAEGNQALVWRFGGSANVLNLLMNKYTSTKPPIFIEKMVKYNKEVIKIDWSSNNDSILVQCIDGTSYQAQHVIVTVSLGVLKERAHTMFHPALPAAKLRAIEGLGIGTVNKLFIHFTHRWWPNAYNAFSLLWSEEDANSTELPLNLGESVDGIHWVKHIFGFYEVDSFPLILSGWLCGPGARHMETMSDDQIMAGVVYLLEKFIGRPLNVSVPQPEKIIRSSWYSNPHFRGSYSFRSLNADRLETSASHLAEPIIDENGKTMLQFAGEATNSHHFATMHGAVETGWREADRILAHYG